MLIQVLLCMNFDAEVVFFKTFYFYSDWLSPYCGQLTEFPQKMNRRHKKYDSVPTLKALRVPSRLIAEVPCGDLLLLAGLGT